MMLMGSQSVQKKYTTLSHEWLRWGLRFPSGPSFRVGLATILVAAEMIVTAKEAWQMFRDFVEEFTLVRKSTGGVATCRKFPELPATFVLLHTLIDPNDVVPCRVDVYEIQKLCVSARIPIRKNNAKLDPPQRSAIADGAAASPDIRQSMMQWQLAMFEQAMGRRSPSTSPPADRRRQLELEDHRETPEPRSAVEPLDAEHRKKEDRPTTEIDREKDQLVPPAVATTQVKIAADLDHIDRQLEGYMANKKTAGALKKPAASTKAMKKAMKKAAAVGGEVDEEDETSSDEGEDEKSIVVKAPKAKAKAGAKAKGAPKAKA